MYDDAEGTFKVNDIVEFVGILSVTPQLTSFDRCCECSACLILFSSDAAAMDMDEEELRAKCPPSSLVPRLHCVVHRKLANIDMVLSPQQKTQGSLL